MYQTTGLWYCWCCILPWLQRIHWLNSSPEHELFWKWFPLTNQSEKHFKLWRNMCFSSSMLRVSKPQGHKLSPVTSQEATVTCQFICLYVCSSWFDCKTTQVRTLRQRSWNYSWEKQLRYLALMLIIRCWSRQNLFLILTLEKRSQRLAHNWEWLIMNIRSNFNGSQTFVTAVFPRLHRYACIMRNNIMSIECWHYLNHIARLTVKFFLLI